MNGPSRREDTRSVALIVGAGLLGVLATGVVAARMDGPDPRPVRIEVRAQPMEFPAARGTFDGSDRLYGQVETRAGAVHTGFIRWDRNEGSWADVLDASKAGRTSGIRFGHVRAIDPMGQRSARVTLKSGGVVDLTGDATDLGSALRALEVDLRGGGSVRMTWRELKRVEFAAAPSDARPGYGRLHGTLVTRSGLRFTGYVTWDVSEIYTSDVLEGRDHAGPRQIPFHAIESIERLDSRTARVGLLGGAVVELRGEDVGTSNRGITVSDPGLGEVKMDWNELGVVRFHPPARATSTGEFDGGGTIRGTVVTGSGESHTGVVVWDRDEAGSWEMLHGSAGRVEFQVEFGRIARIARAGPGALVQLRDGRTFHLSGSNDVSSSNQGIIVAGDGTIVEVPWRDFAELRLDPPRGR